MNSIKASITLISFWAVLIGYQLPIDLITTTQLEQMSLPKNARLALISNHAACNKHGKTTLDVLRSKGFQITTLLAAEHGFTAQAQAGASVADAVDQDHAIPIMSLYKKDSKEIPETVLQSVDAFLFDMQDVGMRHYTYSATLLKVLESCSKAGKKVIVLDRPNPLGCLIEGPVCQPHSFLSSVPVAVRHGLTMGEIALYCNEYVLEKKADLYVVPIKGYARTDLCTTVLKPLSPNILNLASIQGYSFLGLLGEIKPFDVGIGTNRPFQRIGLPKELLSNRSWQHLAELLLKKGVISTFITYERRGIEHAGLDLTFGDSSQLFGFESLLEILTLCKTEHVAITPSPYFTACVGSSLLNEFLDDAINVKTLVSRICTQHTEFLTRAHSIALYTPLPQSRWVR